MTSSLRVRLLLVAGTLLVASAAHWAMLRSPVIADEPLHHQQILAIAAGNWALHPWIATLPGYHALTAVVVALLGSETQSAVRAASSLLGLLLCIPAFAIAAARLGGERDAALRMAGVVLLPILFPYLFLIYTDAVALAAVLFAVWAAERRRHGLAGWLAVLSIGFRQTNAVWLLWLCARYLADVRPWRDGNARPWSAWMPVVPFVLGTLTFGVFVSVNGGVALGDELNHPIDALHDENLFFLLLTAGLLFLPIHVAQAAETWRSTRESLGRARAVALALALGACFLVGFQSDHPYNALPYHVHNDVAMWLNHIGNRIAVAPLVVWTAYSLCAAIASRREAILWALATVVVLAPAWMIEQRYYIVALVVWVLLRKRLPPWLEGVQLVWTAMLAIAVFHMTRWGQYSL
jgi:alpha-1,2-glucosyltransferase